MKDGVSRLLARGGRAFGLAAIAYTRGQRAGVGPWHALDEDIVKAAEQILTEIENGFLERDLEVATARALGEAPATAAPVWASPLAKRPALFETLGTRTSVFPVDCRVPLPSSAKERGIAAVGLALCRSLDAARALAATMPTDIDSSLLRWARLFAAVARPGEPSAARGEIRSFLESEEVHGIRD